MYFHFTVILDIIKELWADFFRKHHVRPIAVGLQPVKQGAKIGAPSVNVQRKYGILPRCFISLPALICSMFRI